MRPGACVRCLSDRVGVFLHRWLVTLDALDETELGTRPVEVVPGTMHAEVDVAVDEVGQEPEPDRERHQLARERDQGPFVTVQHRACSLEVPAAELLEQRHLHLDLREIPLVFQGRAGGRTDHVAEVVQRAPRHHGVEVDHAHRLLSGLVEHHVVELRVVVRDALRDAALSHFLEDDVDDLLVLQGKADLGFRLRDSFARVGLDGGQEGVVAATGVVEMGDGIGEAGAADVGEGELKVTEGLTGLVGVFEGGDGFVGFDALDEDEGAPAGAVGRSVEQLPIAGGDDGEDAAADVFESLGFELAALVAGGTVDVVHDRVGVLEDLGVQLLMDVADGGPALFIGGEVGLVDVPDLAGGDVLEVTVDLELL